MPDKFIFCEIVNGSRPSYRIYEDSSHMAILDVFPNIKGQTLVMPKKHMDSYVFRIKDDEHYGSVTQTALQRQFLKRFLAKSIV